MKRLFISRLTPLLICLLMLASCITLLILPASAQDVSVMNGSGTRNPVRVETTYAYRAKVNAEFTAFAFSMPTWTETDCACTLALFAWTGDPVDSLAAEPIASVRIDPLKDNAKNRLEFDPQPAGEYLFAVLEPRGSVGVWTQTDVTDGKGFLYLDGSEKSHEPDLTVTFVGNPEQPFDKCEPFEIPIDGKHTSPDEYVIPEDSAIYTHEVMPDTWVFTDGLGRTSLTNADVGDPREDKTVAIFFWTWHNGRPTVINVNNAVEQYPEAARDKNHPVWTPGGFQGSWNESIYGYYESTDQWVLRRQSELLANAGIDAVLTDNTNGTATHKSGYTALFESWSDAMDDGVLTPKVSFMMPFGGGADTNTQVRELYMDFYRNGEYHKLWFYWEGKPMLMARGESINTGDNAGKEISKFFTWRGGQPGYKIGKTKYKDWGWLSTYPQALYYTSSKDRNNGVVEQMTVGIAQNHNYELGMISAMSGDHVMGRSYTHDYQNRYEVEGKEASKWGYNFAEQWGYALEIDPKVIFITGWNEWAMANIDGWPQGYASAVPNAFCDQFNDEFSRDIEPTKGDLKDHYYYQMVNFIRQYKGVRPIPTPSKATTIDITAGNAQWNTAEPYYAAYIGNTDDRDGKGWGTLTYHEYSGRNDIIGARVARDEDYVYFYVECNEDITPYTDPLWMVLYLDTDQGSQGWETFDFVLNKTSPSATKAVLEKFTGNGYETEAVGEVDYTVSGKYMQIKVPKSMLGLSGYDFTINFTWTDNVHDEADQGAAGQTGYVYTTFSGDIMDFYISGDVAPSGRFKYSYISTAANATGEDTSETTPAPETTLPDSDTEPEQTTQEIPEQPEPGGCKTVIGAGTVIMLALSMAAAVVGKKKI